VGYNSVAGNTGHMFKCHQIMPNIMSLGKIVPLVPFAWHSVKIRVIFGAEFERQKVDKKADLHKNCKIYSGVLSMFLPNLIKIYAYKIKLYRFKIGAFFETQYKYRSVLWHWWQGKSI